MSISKLQAALAAATNEVTVAAANINFDFTLVKYEAPKEYQPLGEVLSGKRKSNAETGSSHITAQRLGALFEGVCPPTPNLVKAYGIRASEIAKAAKDKISSDYANSIFSAYTGIDGTTIWAAATSSKAALHVHLLACILARHWSAQEAISIWVELVKERKRDIAKRLEDGESFPFSLAAAACQQEIPRSQLAEWDASARAWQRTADAIKARQQVQLNQILNNVSLPVNQNTRVLPSVIAAWTSALETMEKLICGMPQAVQDGAALLGIRSWYIYPDIAVFGTRTVDIRMADPLVTNGGLLTLGLSQSRADTNGVYWCLSLAHLRHYGRPVQTERQLRDDSSRLTFPQLLQATLGCLFGMWKVVPSSTEMAAKVVTAFGESLGGDEYCKGHAQWAHMIADTASSYLNARDEDAETSSKIIQLGRRRANRFIGSESTTAGSLSEWPFFGLLDWKVLMNCFKDSEAGITYLRHVVSRFPGLKEQDVALRYFYGDMPSLHHGDSSQLKRSSSTTQDVEKPRPQKRVRASKSDSSSLAQDTEYQEENMAVDSDTSLTSFDMESDIIDAADSDWGPEMNCDLDEGCSEATSSRIDKWVHRRCPGFATAYPSCWVCSASTQNVENCAHHHRWFPCSNISIDTSSGEFLSISNRFAGSSTSSIIRTTQYLNGQPQVRNLEYLCGDTEVAAIFLAKEEKTSQFFDAPPQVTIEDILWCFENNLFSNIKLLSRIGTQCKSSFHTLVVLSVVSKVYSLLPEATIAVNILEKCLLSTKWAKYLRDTNRLESQPGDGVFGFYDRLNRKVAFGIVTYFESGYIDIELDQLGSVIAISSGDSLYVAMQVYFSEGYGPL